ncbi:hypothetical protein BGW42_005706 [Actinomortierella wolfii]|nr:hypothetical protein BGW42_005706 [Actinomortierella wolfii]
MASTSSFVSSTESDPRRFDTILPYKPEPRAPEEDEPDVHGFIAILFAIVGVIFRNRMALWVGMLFSLESFLNASAIEGGLLGSPAATLMFSISTLVMNYMPEFVVWYQGYKAASTST